MTRARPNGALLAAIWGFAVFMPTFRGLVGTAGAVLVNGGLILAGSAILLGYGLRVPFRDHSERTVAAVVLASLLYYGLALTFSTAFLAETVIPRDAFELHKPVLHTLSFLLPFVLVTTEQDVKSLKRVLGACFFGIVIVATLQYAVPAPMAWLYTKASNATAGRLTVPFGNPYDFGFVMTFFVYFFLFRYFRGFRARHLIWAGFAAAMIVLTQSRTAVITLAFSLGTAVPLILVVQYRDALADLELPGSVLRYLGLLALAGVAAYGVVLAFQDEIRYLVSGIGALLAGREQSSLNVRLEQLRVTFMIADSNPLTALLGNGVSKAGMQYLESGYVFFLFRYGALGLVLIFVLPLTVVAGSGLRTLGRWRAAADPLVAAVVAWLLSLFVASIGNNFTEQPKLSFMYYFLIGVAIRLSRPMEASRAETGEAMAVVAGV